MMQRHAPFGPGMGRPSPEEETIDIGALFGAIWRGKLMIAGVTLMAVLIGGYYALRVAVPMYQATAVVILETQQQAIVDLQSVMSGLSGETAEVTSEVEVLRSRGLMEKVVAREGLTRDPEFNARLRDPGLGEVLRARMGLPVARPEVSDAVIRNATIDALLNRVTIRNLPNSVVFQITVQTRSPMKSAGLADTIAELYVLNQLEVKFEATQQATSWLAERVAELQAELETAEAKESNFSAGTDLISVEALEGLERQLKEQRERIDAAAKAQAQAIARAERVAAAAGESRARQAHITGDPQLAALLSATAPEGQRAFDARFAQVTARARLEASRATSQLNALQASARALEGQIATQNEDLITLQQLTRESEASRLLYEYFLGRLKETSAQQGIQQADSRILSHAVPPLVPASPRIPLILAMAALSGLIVGAAFAVLKESRQDTFRSNRDLERTTGLSVMGQIPLMPTRRRKDVLGYLADRPSSSAAEAIRNLRTSVLLSNPDRAPKVIMSASSLPGEGKTTMSLALAQNLVGTGKRVLLIEGDIRRRVFGQFLESGQTRGLLSVMAGEARAEDVVIHDPRIGADILIGEQSSLNAADIFSSESFATFIADMRSRYDFIVIDTPPVLVVPDARVIAQSADAILFTVKWDSTSKSQVDEALHMFDSVNQRISGLVLNQISARGMKRYGLAQNYGAYAEYGQRYYSN